MIEVDPATAPRSPAVVGDPPDPAVRDDAIVRYGRGCRGRRARRGADSRQQPSSSPWRCQSRARSCRIDSPALRRTSPTGPELHLSHDDDRGSARHPGSRGSSEGSPTLRDTVARTREFEPTIFERTTRRASERRRRSLHPRIVRGSGYIGGRPSFDRRGAQLVVQGSLGRSGHSRTWRRGPRATLRHQRTDVDRIHGHMGGRVGGGDPSRRFAAATVSGDRLAKKLNLVVRGAHPSSSRTRCAPSRRLRRVAHGPEQVGVEVGEPGDMWHQTPSRPVGERTVVRCPAVQRVCRRRLLMLPAKAAGCCQHVCAFAYADDMCRRLERPRSSNRWGQT